MVRLFVGAVPLLVVPVVRAFYVDRLPFGARVVANAVVVVLKLVLIPQTRVANLFPIPKTRTPNLLQVQNNPTNPKVRRNKLKVSEQ